MLAPDLCTHTGLHPETFCNLMRVFGAEEGVGDLDFGVCELFNPVVTRRIHRRCQCLRLLSLYLLAIVLRQIQALYRKMLTLKQKSLPKSLEVTV
jgi:hypothetical protein